MTTIFSICGHLLSRIQWSHPVPLYAPIVQDLKQWVISDAQRKEDFVTAIQTARSYNSMEFREIQCLDDYFAFLNEQLHWVPSEAVQAKELLWRICKVWFLLDQPSVVGYQSPISPSSAEETKPPRLSWLSEWMVRYNQELGQFMDSPASAASLETFKSSPLYNIQDYVEPRGGWKTFNEFFCRHVKPGRRPIAGIGDNTVVTSPADFQFKGLHAISAESTVTTKGLTWPIAQILVDSPYKNHFANGVWLHGFLNVDDYHRVHTPVGGVVLEARTVIGQHYMQVQAVDHHKSQTGAPSCCSLDVVNESGYQFCQARGLIIVDTGDGLVAILPVGMAMVSSVIITAEPGVTLHKGEELAYFQFGGSDVVLIFEDRLRTTITMEPGWHYKMGMEIGRLGL